MATPLGSPADLGGIWAGWEPVLFNQTHDLASGVMTDHVYEDTIRSYEFAKRRAEAIIDAKWDVITSPGSSPAGRVRSAVVYLCRLARGTDVPRS